MSAISSSLASPSAVSPSISSTSRSGSDTSDNGNFDDVLEEAAGFTSKQTSSSKNQPTQSTSDSTDDTTELVTNDSKDSAESNAADVLQALLIPVTAVPVMVQQVVDVVAPSSTQTAAPTAVQSTNEAVTAAASTASSQTAAVGSESTPLTTVTDLSSDSDSDGEATASPETSGAPETGNILTPAEEKNSRLAKISLGKEEKGEGTVSDSPRKSSISNKTSASGINAASTAFMQDWKSEMLDTKTSLGSTEWTVGSTAGTDGVSAFQTSPTSNLSNAVGNSTTTVTTPAKSVHDVPEIVSQELNSPHLNLPKRIEIPLQTPRGAAVTLYLQEVQGQVRAQFSTNDRSTMDWLNQQIPSLKETQFETSVKWSPPQMDGQNSSGQDASFARDQRRYDGQPYQDEGSDPESLAMFGAAMEKAT